VDDGSTRYASLVRAEWPEVDLGNLRFSLDVLFEGVTLTGSRMLDVGAGDGLRAFYAACAGAAHVVALEPEAAGSSGGVRAKFQSAAGRLGQASVELRPDTFQAYEAAGEPFDVLLLQAAVNHLDEQACMALHRDPRARDTYRALFAKLADMSADGAKLIVADCSRRNLFASLPVRNPLAPTIEWAKHQPPHLWCELLTEAGFADPRLRWTSLNTLRNFGRLLTGNRVAAWFLMSSFQLTMTRRRSA
jgi:hypothetical protein